MEEFAGSNEVFRRAAALARMAIDPLGVLAACAGVCTRLLDGAARLDMAAARLDMGHCIVVNNTTLSFLAAATTIQCVPVNTTGQPPPPPTAQAKDGRY